MKIHDDQFRNLQYQLKAFQSLISPSQLDIPTGIRTIAIRDINDVPYYWINQEQLYNASNGGLKEGITEREALYVASQFMDKSLKVSDIELINEVDK